MGKEVKAQRGLRSGKGTSVTYGHFALPPLYEKHCIQY